MTHGKLDSIEGSLFHLYLCMNVVSTWDRRMTHGKLEGKKLILCWNSKPSMVQLNKLIC